MMRTLNLDSMFVPVSLPEIEYNLFQFNGGEWSIKLNSRINYSKVDKVIITHRIKDMNDVMKILIAKDALELQDIKHFDLVIPYIPYARQDRQCDQYESFTLKIFTNIINSANFDYIYVIDPHSDVSPALLNNCKQIKYNYFIDKTYDIISNESSDLLLVSPDAGSNKKVNKVFNSIGKFKDIIKCDKIRNLSDGSLSGFLVMSDDLNGMDCLIVDDICDGGRTFIGISKELKKKNAGKVYLYVTHGIFSNGFDDLLNNFDGIFCTNSFKDIENIDKITQFKINL